MKSLVMKIMVLAALALAVSACGIYSFTGTSIQPDIKTVTINYFEYKAVKVNPSLSTSLTEELKSQYRRMTKLEQVEEDGDLEIEGAVTGYEYRPTAVTAREIAEKMRLTVTVKIKFTNRKYPEEDFEKSFSAFGDYDASLALESVQDELCKTIVETIVNDIMNATVANW
ncbi:MAG: LptE family protein [Bacteroidales bacterium]|nr:LptE family protein [Bacteroidales bacterium]MCR5244619.1 hypothetical protein [Bacteroidales bacterium]MDT3356170.1 LPS assembly lipoprotein LptE [Bacteroidota bacterium]